MPGTETPKKPAGGKRRERAPGPRQWCNPWGFRVYYVKPSMHKEIKVTEGSDLPQKQNLVST